MTGRHPVVYLRKSKKQEESRAAQLNAVMALVRADGHNGDTIVYDDHGRSGDRAKLGKRTAWAEMLEAIERNEVSAVYVRVLDRTGRSLEEWLRFLRVCAEHHARIIDQTGDRSDPERKDSALFEMWAAEKELDKAKERSAYTRRLRLERGDGMGPAPYGWRHVREEGTRRIIAVRDESIPLATVLEVARASRSVLAAGKELTRRGIPAPQGGTGWSTRTLTRILEKNAPELLPRQGVSSLGKVSGKPRRVPASSALLSQLLRCSCGSILSPAGQRSYYCYRGHLLGSEVHGKTHISQRKVMTADTLPDGNTLPDELTFRLAERRVPSKDNARQRAELETQRDRLRADNLELVKAGLLDKDAALRDMAKISADLERLEEQEEIVNRVTLDWQAEAQEINGQLRSLIRWIQLDPDMQPIGIEWRGIDTVAAQVAETDRKVRAGEIESDEYPSPG